MAKFALEPEYSLRDSVLVGAIGIVGTIDGVSFDNYGLMYRVVYWNDGDRKVVWLYPDELQDAPPVRVLGVGR